MPSRRRPPASKVAMPLTSSSACGNDSCRMRPLVSSALPATTGAVAVPVMRAVTSARPELRMSGRNPCSTARFAAPLACSASDLIDQVHRAAEIELGVVTDHLQRIDLQHLVLDAQPDRRLIAQAVVEQPQVHLLDVGVDAQRIRVVELADDANRAAGDRRRERRERRLQDAQVRIERRVGDAERQLRVHFVVQLDAAGARHREARRRRFELVGHQQAAHRQAAGHFADALVAEEQVADAPLDVVARLLERAAAGRGEVERSVQRRVVRETRSASACRRRCRVRRRRTNTCRPSRRRRRRSPSRRPSSSRCR